jgi:hypothetical protein
MLFRILHINAVNIQAIFEGVKCKAVYRNGVTPSFILNFCTRWM